MKQYIKETRFYHHTFLFFMYVDLSFINTAQKTLKPSKKMFQFPGWMRKNFIPRNFSWKVSADTWDASCFKKGRLEKQQSVPNTCDISPLKKIFFSKLNRCIFQISLKYIKLVIPEILFILVLCNFSFYLKITWPPFFPPTIYHYQNKNFAPLQQRLFQNF